MNTLKIKRSKQDDNFETLSALTMAKVYELAVDTANAMVDGIDHYQDDVDSLIQEIEFNSRDGFWAAESNRGGLTIRLFTTVGELVGTGHYMGFNDSAEAEINRQYAYGLKCALENFKEKYAEEIKGIPEDKLNYHDLYELGRSDLAESLSEYERENTYDDQSSIMLEARMMYHGQGQWSVSAVVNTEGPYHRSHISWMPGLKCEHGSEIECTTAQLRSTMNKLLDKELGVKLA